MTEHGGLRERENNIKYQMCLVNLANVSALSLQLHTDSLFHSPKFYQSTDVEFFFFVDV